MKQIYLLFALIPYQTQEADRIIIGTVTDVKLSYDCTIVTIEVDEWLQNPLPAEAITVRTEGGTNVWVEDEASFTANETVLPMLEDVKVSENRFKVLW